jgi:subtilisin family serine protease
MWNWRAALRFCATLALGVFCLAGDAVWSQNPPNGRRVRTVWVDGREAIEGEVLVRYRADIGPIGRQRAEFQADTDEAEAIGRRGTRRMRSRRLGTRAMIDALRANPDVEFVEPNYVIRILTTPNEPWFPSLWALFNNGQSINGTVSLAGADIKAAEAWTVTTGARDTVVGIVDTGIDYHHPDLAANIWTAPRAFTVTIGGVVITCAAGTHGFNAIDNTCDPFDDHSHGTHVAGTIGAVGNNGVGVTGVNWIASMMGLKFLSASGSGSTANAIKAIDFAIQAKAALGAGADVRILSNSWGGGGYSQSLRNEIDAANANNMLFVAAAGNSAMNNDADPQYPSSYTTANMISVAATTNRDQRASFSNWGATSVHLGAPGQAILSTVPNNRYAYYNGTSMATPHVAGGAALVLAACPLSTADLRTLLLTSVDPIASMAGITMTGGRLNVNAAVRACPLAPSSLTVMTPTVNPGGTIRIEAADGAGRPRDWVGLYADGAGDVAFVNWFYLNGQKTVPAAGVSAATLQIPAPLTPGTYQARLFYNGGYTRLATSGAIIVVPLPALPAPATTLTATASVHPGGAIEVQVGNGPGHARDWVGLYTSGSGDSTFVDWAYLNGAKTPPPTGLSTTTMRFTAPAAPGSYEVRLFADNGYTKVATSLPITVAPIQGSGPALTVITPMVPRGGLIQVTVTNGAGGARDWIGVYQPVATDYGFIDWVYLNGLKTPPAGGQTNVTVYVPAPAVAGPYQLRLFADGGYNRVAMSGTVTVLP